MSTDCKVGAPFKPLNRSGLRLGLSLIIALSVITSPTVMLLNPTLVEASSPKSTDPTSFSVPSTIVQNGGADGDPEFTTQAALTSPSTKQTNNIVNTQSEFAVTFKTSTTGVIKKILVTFPAGTNLGSVNLLITREGIGPGVAEKTSSTTITYTVDSAVSVPAGRLIKLEFGTIVNSPNPGNQFVTVSTRTASNAIIDGPTAIGYSLKQIGTDDIADGAITNSKLALFAVNTPNIVPQSITGDKLEFGTVTSDKVVPGTFGLPVVQRIGPFVNIPFGAPFITQTDASCLSGEQVIGGGNAISFSDDDALSFIYLGGFVVGNSWRAAATNGDPSSTISFASVAICALDFPL